MRQLDAIVQFLVIPERRNERHATDKMMRCLVSSAKQSKAKQSFSFHRLLRQFFFCISANLIERWMAAKIAKITSIGHLFFWKGQDSLRANARKEKIKFQMLQKWQCLQYWQDLALEMLGHTCVLGAWLCLNCMGHHVWKVASSSFNFVGYNNSSICFWQRQDFGSANLWIPFFMFPFYLHIRINNIFLLH